MIHSAAFKTKSPLTSYVFNSLETADFTKMGLQLSLHFNMKFFFADVLSFLDRKSSILWAEMACSDFSSVISVCVLEFKGSSGLPTSHLASGPFCHAAPGWRLWKLQADMAGLKGEWEVKSDLKTHALHKPKGRATDVLSV